MSGYDLIANTAGALLSAVIVRFRTGRWGVVELMLQPVFGTLK